MQRIQWTRFMGKIPAGAKAITRGNSSYGNPWRVGEHGTRDEVVARFTSYLDDRSQYPDISYPSDEQILRDLDGYDLACACNHQGPCHGDPLIAKVETLRLLAGVR